jgi:hypothetical protein
MPRDPNSPIPGFDDEFTGTVGKEKRIHRTHFGVTWERPWKSDKDGWIQVNLGRWKRIQEHKNGRSDDKKEKET